MSFNSTVSTPFRWSRRSSRHGQWRRRQPAGIVERATGAVAGRLFGLELPAVFGPSHEEVAHSEPDEDGDEPDEESSPRTSWCG